MLPLWLDTEELALRAFIVFVIFVAVCVAAAIMSLGADTLWYLWTRHHLFCGLAQAPDLHCRLGAPK